MRTKIINPEFIINTLDIVREILFIHHNTSQNYFIYFIYLNCSTMDVIHVLICAKKDRFKNSKLENTLCISFNSLVLTV